MVNKSKILVICRFLLIGHEISEKSKLFVDVTDPDRRHVIGEMAISRIRDVLM